MAPFMWAHWPLLVTVEMEIGMSEVWQNKVVLLYATYTFRGPGP